MAFFASPVCGFTPRYDGEYQVGARARFYDAGTNTPKEMFQDGLLNAPFDPDDITTDANGQFPAIWGQGGAYKAIITTAGGQTIREMDNLPGDTDAGGGGGGGGGDGNIETGDYILANRTGSRTGYVRANGKTIGSLASGATERANADCEALFTLFWADTSLVVSGGRGGSAAADWAANKTIALPDVKGRLLAGLDDMGDTAAGRLTGGTFATGTATTLGATGGSATVALTSAQNGSHTHTGSTDNGGNHQHTGSTAGAGSHTHTAVSDFQGSHSHGAVTGADGSHSHSASADTQGDHSHTYTAPTGSALGGTAPSSVVQATTGASTSTAGAHSHTITVNAVGAHSHTISTDGSHAHNIGVFSVGDHTHTYTTDAAGTHTHTFTTAASGSGSAHNNLAPFILCTVYIRL